MPKIYSEKELQRIKPQISHTLENRFQEYNSAAVIYWLFNYCHVQCCLQQTRPCTKLHGHDIIFVVYFVLLFDQMGRCLCVLWRWKIPTPQK